MSEDFLSIGIIFLLIGTSIGIGALHLIQRLKLKNFKKIAQQLIQNAEREAEELKKEKRFELKQLQIDQQRQFETQWQSERKKIQISEERLKQREDKLEARLHLVEKKLHELDRRETVIEKRKTELDNEEKHLAHLQEKLFSDLEKSSGLSAKEARLQLLNQIESEIKIEAAHLVRRKIKEAHDEAEQEARRIITTSINRMAVSCVSETTVNTISLPNEEMKGRIIGREGKNIRTFERATGVNIVIDDTPNAVVLSGFDPVRMQIAKTALIELIHDGRIHPTHIEEAVERAKVQVKKSIKSHGEDAALRVGLMDLHPEIITLLGKLKFRFSYGQNVLEHSLEVAHLMGMMCAELGLDVQLAKRIGLLHDMGKAVSHEIDGSHALIGYDLALKFGESEQVANGVGCHHREMEAITIEGSLCGTADALSASRYGARCESVETYVKRLKQLEDLACGFNGVEKAYAMQAGRELLVSVMPDQLNDDASAALARSLTRKIEQELQYPGKIKVVVVREVRTTEYAL